MKTSLTLIVFCLLSLCSIGQKTLLIPPVIKINDAKGLATLAPDGMTEYRMLENIQRSLKWGETDYTITTSFLEAPTTYEEMKSLMQMQFVGNPQARIIHEGEYNGFLVIQFKQEFMTDDGKDLSMFMEIAITVAEDDFVIGISAERATEAELNLNLFISLLESIQFIPTSVMDQELDLPLNAEIFQKKSEAAYDEKRQEDFYQLKRDYQTKFNYYDYYKALRGIRDGIYTIQDMLDMFFEKESPSDLVAFRNMVGNDITYPLIEGNYPMIREQFIQKVQAEFFDRELFVQDLYQLNDKDRSFVITSGSLGTSEYKNRIVKFIKKDKWKMIDIQLPPALSNFEEMGTDWGVEESTEQWLVIRMGNGEKYFIKDAQDAFSDWQELSVIPSDSARYSLIMTGVSMYENIQFTSAGSYVPRSNLLFDELFLNAEKQLIADKKALLCDEYPDQFSYQNIQLKKHPQYCCNKTDYEMAVRRTSAASTIAFTSAMERMDIDGDGNEELYVYTVSNGKIISMSGVTYKSGKVIPIKKSTFMKWAKKNKAIQNLLLYSKMRA
ncbi:MAG: hypothetical protein ACK4WD_09850 [Flavobacteriales bacterium]